MGIKVTKGKTGSVATATVEMQDVSGAINEESIEVAEVQVTGQPAEVEYSAGMTKNMGNYESIRFHISIKVPCSNTAEDINASYDFAKGWVDEKVIATLGEIESSLS